MTLHRSSVYCNILKRHASICKTFHLRYLQAIIKVKGSSILSMNMELPRPVNYYLVGSRVDIKLGSNLMVTYLFVLHECIYCLLIQPLAAKFKQNDWLTVFSLICPTYTYNPHNFTVRVKKFGTHHTVVPVYTLHQSWLQNQSSDTIKHHTDIQPAADSVGEATVQSNKRVKALQSPPWCSLSSLVTGVIGPDAINMGEYSCLESGLSIESLVMRAGLQVGPVGTMHHDRCGHMELLYAATLVMTSAQAPCDNNTTLGNRLCAQRKGPSVTNSICLTCENCPFCHTIQHRVVPLNLQSP